MFNVFIVNHSHIGIGCTACQEKMAAYLELRCILGPSLQLKTAENGLHTLENNEYSIVVCHT